MYASMRADFSSYQGEGPQAYWRQVKGLQRRYGGKDAAGLYRFRLRLECVSKMPEAQLAGNSVAVTASLPAFLR